MAEWISVWIVLAVKHSGFIVRECEGHELCDGNWTVNTRGKGCRSKLLETVPDAFVHRTQESAEKRKQELEQDST